MKTLRKYWDAFCILAKQFHRDHPAMLALAGLYVVTILIILIIAITGGHHGS